MKNTKSLQEFVELLDKEARKNGISYILGFVQTENDGANPQAGYSEYQHHVADLNYAASLIIHKEGASDWIHAALLRDLVGMKVVPENGFDDIKTAKQ